MTPEMLAKSRQIAARMGCRNVDFREGYAENLPVEDGWAGVVISNGVINLCADKRATFKEIYRVLRPGGPASPRRAAKRIMGGPPRGRRMQRTKREHRSKEENDWSNSFPKA
jgi:ubiquinone/menaquinone biosynthesis C-methylase UbiE